MSHEISLNIDIREALETEPLRPAVSLTKLMWTFVLLGTAVFILGLFVYPAKLLWGFYYTNVVFWMGLAFGGALIPAIFQIVRAKWAPPVWRIAEANVLFLPVIYFLFLCTYFGRAYLFPWATKPFPGREWWMQPDFVYARFAFMFLFMVWLFSRYMAMSLREDIGLLRESSGKRAMWQGLVYKYLASNWRGYDREISILQPKMSCSAPVLVIFYAIFYTMFATEMVMSMDPVWYSNLFGAFNFTGNVYIGWAALSLWTMVLSRHHQYLKKVITTQQLWDLGKLAMGFAMLWGYMFFAQFLPQWYGNLPEETQWLILRTREMPWKALGWFTFSCAFVIPFMLLWSEDLKKNPKTFMPVCLMILMGVFFEKFMVIMPELSPDRVPLAMADLVFALPIFLGFLGAYVLCLRAFLGMFPVVPVGHPLTRGVRDW